MAEKKSMVVIKKKKGGGHGGHHGGAWKVAYADFVTAMMAFFLVMWLMGSDEQTKAEITHYFNHPNTSWRFGRDPESDMVRPLGERIGNGESVLNGLGGGAPDEMVPNPQRPVSDQMQANQELSDRVHDDLEDLAYAFEVEIDHMKFSLKEDLIFKPGTTEFAPTAQKYLGRVGDIVRGFRGYVQIVGHTDPGRRSVASDSASRYEFSMSQAVSVMKYLVSERWITEDRVSPRGLGAETPFSNSDTNESHSKNNRIEFILHLDKKLKSG